MKWIIPTLLIAFGLPTPALACLVGAGDALIHSSVPDGLPDDIVVLRVHLTSRDLRLLYSTGLPAKVDHVEQGPVTSRRIILQTSFQSSCEWPLENGSHGLIVGRLTGERDGTPIVEPVFAPIENGFRLEDGAAVPTRPDMADFYEPQ